MLDSGWSNAFTRSTPTFLTPGNGSSSLLVPEQHRGNHEASRELVEFVLLHCEENTWPVHKNEAMWNAAELLTLLRMLADIISPICHIGNAWRYKVVGEVFREVLWSCTAKGHS